MKAFGRTSVPRTVQTAGESDATANPKQAADFNNDGDTANPDLVSVASGGENELRFTFDEETSEIGDTSGFNFYADAGTETDVQNVELADDLSVVALRFESAATPLPTRSVDQSMPTQFTT